MKPVLSILAACALGALVAGCGGGSSSSSSTTTTTTASSAPAAAGASTSDGAKIYDTNCSSCHGAAGAGAKGMFPPLAGNATVTGDPMAVVHIVRNGLTGTIKVNGSTYNGQMPAWKAQLSNADIAAVITHIRTSWGNKASAVTEAQVAADK